MEHQGKVKKNPLTKKQNIKSAKNSKSFTDQLGFCNLSYLTHLLSYFGLNNERMNHYQRTNSKKNVYLTSANNQTPINNTQHFTNFLTTVLVFCIVKPQTRLNYFCQNAVLKKSKNAIISQNILGGLGTKHVLKMKNLCNIHRYILGQLIEE